DADLTTVFKTVAMALISKVGGASGPLYGTAFLEMAKASKAGTTDLPTLLAAALAGIEKRGGAQAGDKTMLDVWVPVVAAVQADKLDATVIA
ncbi:DAK2 domain-containing protein, partial [Staphylococcus epidermidis]